MLAFIFLTLFATSSYGALCPNGYRHMTSIDCGTSTRKAIVCTPPVCENTGRKLLSGECISSTCKAPSVSWMTSVCNQVFGTSGTIKWEPTESTCYPENPAYWLAYRNYQVSGDFCSNFPRVKRSNNLQFERGNLLFWQTSGDVSVVSSEDGILPTRGKFMVKLVSGGTLSRNDFFIQPCAKSIQFSYNFLTTEEGEVEYNDYMTIKIFDESKEYLSASLDQLSVQSFPSSATGVWRHVSGWNTVRLSLTNVPKDTVLRLSIESAVFNVGDDALPSAVLIDQIKYNV